MDSIHYFVSSNCPNGFVTFMESNLPKNKIILNSYPQEAAEIIVKSVIDRAIRNDTDVEIIHNCLDNSIEGVVLPKFNTGIINMPFYYSENYCINYLENEQDLLKCKECLSSAYDYLKSALKTHDEWEEIYLDNIDFNELNSYTDEIIETVIPKTSFNKVSVIKDRFFGATTVNGPFDYCNDIISNIKKRYFIKGRPGSGKSTMLKKIIEQAKLIGCDVDVYHCGFDVKSIDMIYLKDLDIVIFDSTAPHEYFPDRKDDEVIDVYKRAITDGTDEKYQNQLDNIVIKYRSDIAVAVKYLNDAYNYSQNLNKKYMERLDYREFEKTKSIIIDKCFCSSHKH